jgi:hypothetical protein
MVGQITFVRPRALFGSWTVEKHKVYENSLKNKLDRICEVLYSENYQFMKFIKKIIEIIYDFIYNNLQIRYIILVPLLDHKYFRSTRHPLKESYRF